MEGKQVQQGTDVCARLPRQAETTEHPGPWAQSALHAASEAGLASTVAKLLSLGANAMRPERWVCTYMKTLGYICRTCTHISWYIIYTYAHIPFCIYMNVYRAGRRERESSETNYRTAV